jgi:hypothetical protein
MTKYHVALNGQAAICEASSSPCPRQDFASLREAQVWGQLNPKRTDRGSLFNDVEDAEIARRLRYTTSHAVASDFFGFEEQKVAWEALKGAGYDGRDKTWNHEYLKGEWEQRHRGDVGNSYWAERDRQLAKPTSQHRAANAEEQALELAQSRHPGATNLRVVRVDADVWGEVVASRLADKGSAGGWLVYSGEQRTKQLGAISLEEVSAPETEIPGGVRLLQEELPERVLKAEGEMEKLKKTASSNGVAEERRVQNKLAAMTKFRKEWAPRFAVCTSVGEVQDVLREFDEARSKEIPDDWQHNGWNQGLDVMRGYVNDYVNLSKRGSPQQDRGRAQAFH